MDPDKLSKIKANAIMTLFPLGSIVFNAAVAKMDLSLAVLFVVLGLLVAFFALILGIVGSFMPQKARNYFLVTVIVLSVISLIPAVLFSLIFLFSIVEEKQGAALEEQRSYVYFASQLSEDLHAERTRSGLPYPENLDEFLARSPFNADYYDNHTNYFEKTHYRVSPDRQHFVVYVELNTPKSKLLYPAGAYGGTGVTEVTLGIDCTQEKTYCKSDASEAPQ